MKLYLIDCLEEKEYKGLFSWLKREGILLPSTSTYSPKQHRSFDKLYVTPSEVVMLFNRLYSKEHSTGRYSFTQTDFYKAIMRLADLFSKAGVTNIYVPMPSKDKIIDGKLIISRVFDSWECNIIRAVYFRATMKNLPRFNNKFSYVSADELKDIKSISPKVYGKWTLSILKRLEELLNNKGD